MMKKKAMVRFMVGAPWGLVIGMVIIVCISLSIGDGMLTVAAAPLIASVGGELNAFMLQCLATMVYGGCWAAASVIWETEWSLLRQTLTHLACCASSALPAAWLMQWMDHSWQGVFGYLMIFAGVYAGIWLSQYLSMCARVKAMNAKLSQK